MRAVCIAALLISAGVLACCGSPANSAEPKLQRSPLGCHLVQGGKHVARVETQRITMAPGMAAGHHRHPGPVLAYIRSGTAIVQAEGQEQKLVRAGETILEPALTRILRFDNASRSAPLTFIAAYLLGDEDRQLTVMEPEGGRPAPTETPAPCAPL
jgi:mannose-6-phosphate isomerase-like protein (cupin superfamily)